MSDKDVFEHHTHSIHKCVETLRLEGEFIYEKLSKIFKMWNEKLLCDGEMVGIYILCYIQYRKPDTWLQTKRTQTLCTMEDDSNFISLYDISCLQFNDKTRRRLPLRPTIYSLFGNYVLQTIPLPVSRSIVRWLEPEQHWKLTLMTIIPSPFQVLRQQSQGERVVTMIVEKETMSKLIMNEHDAFSFILHDLCHSNKFYLNQDNFHGQVGFYRLILQAIDADLFSSKMLESDSQFSQEFDYCISDMNTYCVHLLKYLKACLLFHFLRINGQRIEEKLNSESQYMYEQFLEQLMKLWNMNDDEKEAVRCLNSDEFRAKEHCTILQNYFETHGLLK
ncbi:unnamed protein product [Didymodactylos carnosus]|uniref:Uncharacterized protein n=1 Tax=Didymodactylos carnosus TaxID=1234261 RepID=A0A813TEW6_9BILA|nr:unnamed protein product [Didymodactylos carnosus]CAF1107829.1 unnamed protein product [Didymodactylos carnosus]CAF3594296.1 unnamed protein product [Didymodactylos carnosus]CAF3873066.1 unnamed protein product [Didymodactylos carnosus]